MNEDYLPDARFERLIDGELSREEYSRLLAALDDEPGGWRRCALAFLETQAFGQELSQLRREVEMPAQVSSQPKTVSQPRQWLHLPALAASLLLAIGLGYALRGWPFSAAWPVVEQPDMRVTNPANLRQESVESTPVQKLVGNVTLVVDGAGGAGRESIQLPVYSGSLAAQQISLHNSALPADVRRALEATGHRVEQQQQLVPVSLQDGRQVVFPVEQLRIVPAVRRSY